MRQNKSRNACILLLMISAFFAHNAPAEIYKWVDEDGKVHFGDKPKDPVQANEAELLEINEDYNPPEQTEAELEDLNRERQAVAQRNQILQQRQQEAKREADEKRRQEKIALCAAYEEDIRRFSTMQVINGVRTIHYLADEDGRSLSSKRQQEIVEELKTKMAAAGCN
jgi:hypothetical protein